MLIVFATKILPGEPTPLPLKEELTQRKIIKMTGTAYIVFFMIPSKAETFVPERQMFTVWLRSAQISLINALHRVFPLPVNTEDYWLTVPLVALRLVAPFTLVARLANNSS
jgi:hypothetical protein